MRHSAVLQGWAVLCAALVIVLAALSARAAEPEANAGLVKELIQKNEAARKAIRSLAYTQEQEGKLKREDFLRRSTGHVIRQGESYYATCIRVTVDSANNEKVLSDSCVVVNEQYAAYFPYRGMANAYQDFYDGVSAMAQDTRTEVSISSPKDVMGMLFGSDRVAFGEGLNAKARWDALEEKNGKGEKVYRLRRFAIKLPDPAVPDAEWVIDPNQGYLAVEMLARNEEDGRVFVHGWYQVRQLQPGVWCPVGYEEKRYGAPAADGQEPVVMSWTRVKLKDIVLNKEYPKEQFEVQALKLEEPGGPRRVLWSRPNGETGSYEVRSRKAAEAGNN